MPILTYYAIILKHTSKHGPSVSKKFQFLVLLAGSSKVTLRAFGWIIDIDSICIVYTYKKGIKSIDQTKG